MQAFHALLDAVVILQTLLSSNICRDPNAGDFKVPVSWPEYTKDGQKFLEINEKMDGNSIGQEMRQPFVHLWGITLAGLPSVTQAKMIQ